MLNTHITILSFMTLRHFMLLSLFISASTVFGQLSVSQTVQQDKMKDLSFMVGAWIGTSSTYKDGQKDKQVPAFQSISYGLDKNIIIIDLHSELLQLHTIISYDKEEQEYIYNPYSKSGSRRAPAVYKDGMLVVNASEQLRYIFHSPSDGHFQEYGEQLEDGRWVRIFEDNFTKTE